MAVVIVCDTPTTPFWDLKTLNLEDLLSMFKTLTVSVPIVKISFSWIWGYSKLLVETSIKVTIPVALTVPINLETVKVFVVTPTW